MRAGMGCPWCLRRARPLLDSRLAVVWPTRIGTNSEGEDPSTSDVLKRGPALRSPNSQGWRPPWQVIVAGCLTAVLPEAARGGDSRTPRGLCAHHPEPWLHILPIGLGCPCFPLRLPPPCPWAAAFRCRALMRAWLRTSAATFLHEGGLPAGALQLALCPIGLPVGQGVGGPGHLAPGPQCWSCAASSPRFGAASIALLRKVAQLWPRAAARNPLTKSLAPLSCRQPHMW